MLVNIFLLYIKRKTISFAKNCLKTICENAVSPVFKTYLAFIINPVNF